MTADRGPTVVSQRSAWWTRVPYGAIAVAFVLMLVLYPVIRLAIRALAPDGQVELSLFEVFAQPWFPSMVGSTLVVVASSTVLAVVIGSLFAWLNERTTATWGLVGDILPLVPLLIPSIGMAIGWIFLADPNAGFLNSILGAIVPGAKMDLYTWPGLVLVYTLNLVPYVYVIVSSALRNLDSSLEEASAVSGAGLARTVRMISIPAIRQAAVGAALLSVMIGMALYSVPSVIGTTAGIDVFSVRIIRLVKQTVPPEIGQAAALGLFLFAVIAFVFYFYQRTSSRGHFATISGKSYKTSKLELGGWRWVARGGMVLYVLLASILPVAALVIVGLQPFWSANINWSTLTFDNFISMFETRTFANSLRNSTVLAAVVGLVSTIVIGAVTIYSRSVLGRAQTFIRGVLKLPAAISSVVLAVAFLVGFAGPPFMLGGTFLILALAYAVHFMPELSIAAESASSQVGADLEEAARVSGAGKLKASFNIVWPLMVPGLLRGWALVFVLIIGELASSTLLASFNTPVVGSVILQVWENGGYGRLAALAATMTAITTATVLIISFLARVYRRRW